MRALLKTILLLPAILVGYHTLVRLIRRYYKFPIPEFLANAIDNRCGAGSSRRTRRRSGMASSRG